MKDWTPPHKNEAGDTVQKRERTGLSMMEVAARHGGELSPELVDYLKEIEHGAIVGERSGFTYNAEGFDT